MVTEDYVSFETAKLLKEKGFDEKCMSYYGHGEFHLGNPKYMRSNTDRDGVACNGVPYDAYNAPTIQMAMKWLREVHKVEVRVSYDIDKTTWWGGCNPMYEENEENSNMFQSLLEFDYPGKTYEEACEATIKYCLENLI